MFKQVKNPSIKNNFIKRLCQFNKIDIDVSTYKQIINDQKTIQTASEEKIKRMSESYDYLFNNLNQEVTKEIIVRTYFLLTNSKVRSKKIDRIIHHYYLNDDTNIYELVSDLHYMIWQTFRRMRLEFSFLVTSYFLMKKGYYPLIINQSQYYQYKRAIRDYQESKLELPMVLYQIEFQNQQIYKDKCHGTKIEREQVISQLREKQSEIKQIYKVENLYIFGSINQGDHHMYSDIDIRVTIRPEWYGIKDELVISLYRYLEEILKVSIDLFETRDCLDTYLMYEFKNHTKIF